MKEKKKVPELRFPGFEGEWEEKKLGEVAELTSSKRIFLSEYVSSGVPFYRGKEITDLKKGNKINDLLYISKDKYNEIKKKYGVPQIDDILITAVGTLANSLKITNDSPFYFKDGNLIWLKKIVENPNFLEVSLESNKHKVLATAIGSNQKALIIVSLNKMKLLFPTDKAEQTKIANFLSDIDSKIEKLTKKKELMEQYKKGMMQTLFSQEIRFKDENGKDYPDWEEKRLGEVATFSKGKEISKVDISEDGNLECIRYGELYTHYKELIDIVYSSTNLNQSNLVLSKTNDVIIPASGETAIDISTASCVLREGIALGGDINIIRTHLNGIFLAYYLNNKKKNDIARLSQGISVIHLYSSQLAGLDLYIPSKEEQQKIANFLSDIDKKIEQIDKELCGVKEFKRGLLQKMFV